MLNRFFEKIDFVLTNADTFILIYQQSDVFIIVGVYIDDFVLIFKSQDGLDWLKN